VNNFFQITLAFFLGSIPFGLIVGRFYSVDIRKVGSGNIGATNVYRNLGKIPGILTFVFDIVKGILPILFFSLFSDLTLETQCILGLAAIVGHCFSPFLAGNGGKGVATSFGVFLYLNPISALIAFVSFVVTLLVSGFVSLGSLVSTLVLFASLVFLNGLDPVSFISLIVIFLVFFRHKDNLKRLIAGEENRFFKS
jgi:glycerol-3-phosphate acyltransferase PlsY